MAHAVILSIKKFAAIGAGVVLALFIFAPILEFTDTSDYDVTHVDPKTGMLLYTPHSVVRESTGCFDSEAQINNIGFHGPDIPSIIKPGVFRIVVIGGSYVEARQVSTAQMFTTLLEQRLNASGTRQYEIIPLGFNGNGTLEDVLYYKYYGSALRPDLVIDLESQHELLYELDAAPLDTAGRPILTPPTQPSRTIIRSALRSSKLLINLYNRAFIFKNASSDFLHHPFSAYSTTATTSTVVPETQRWDIKTPLINALASLVHADSAELLFASYVAPDQPPSASAEFPRHLKLIAQQDDFSYLDLTPIVSARAQTGESATFLPCDGHFSAAGHTYVADALYNYLMAHPALLQK